MDDSGVTQGGRRVCVVDGARTPFLKAKGKPGQFTASDLAVAAGRALIARQPAINPPDFDEVILGCVMPLPEEANIARVVSLRLGCGKKVPAWTVQRNCASGMQAIDSAARNIANGRAELVLAGGVEAMSKAPLLYNETYTTWLAGFMRAKGAIDKLQAISKFRPAMLKPVIGLLLGLTDHVAGLSMGQTAEILAHRFHITREEMDAFAMESHKRLVQAQDENALKEIVTLYDSKGAFYSHDDGVRRDTTMEALAKLKPVFDKPFGSVTAGNSAQVTDGAAWLILASEDEVERRGLPVIGYINDTQWAGVDPAQMGLGPANAIGKILDANFMKSEEVDYWEINEAFAAQVLGVLRAFDDADYMKSELGLERPFAPIPMTRLNVNGGSISIGHPVGASGARITLRLLHTLAQNEARFGIASLCIGGGQGGAMLIENAGYRKSDA